MAGFGKTPTTTTQGAPTTNQFPASSVYPPNKGGSNPTDDFFVLEGGPISTDDDSNKSSPASMYIKDGGNVAQGLTTDGAVVGDNPGTLSAKLRGLGKIFSDIWDNVNHRMRVDGSGVIQPVSGGVSVTNLPSTQAVSGTFWQTTQPVSGSVSVSSLPALPSGVNVIGHVIIDSAGSVSITSLPTLPSGTNVIGHVINDSGSTTVVTALPALPTGANSIGQVTANAGTNLNTSLLALESGHLAAIDTHTPALGQAAMIASSPVVIASDQSKLPTKAASGDFVAGSIADIATLLTLSGTPADANTINSLMGRLTKIRDLLNATLTISGSVTTSGTVTEANSASIKTDLDTVVTNTNKIPSSPAQEGGNLATLVTNTTSIATAANQTTTNTNTSAISTATGATTDVAVTGDTSGTLSAKLRGLSKILFDMWDSANHWLQVKVMNGNANGQAVMSNSAPVVIASNQTTLSINRSATSLFSITQTTVGTNNSGDIAVGPYTEISIDLNTTAQAGTSPTIQFFWNRKGADGIYYSLWTSQTYSAASNKISTSIGAGMSIGASLGSTGQLSWTVGGSSTPTWTFTPNITGK